MRNHLLHGHSPRKIQSGLHALQSQGFRPTIALVFASQNIDYLTVAGNLSYNGMDVVGVTATRTLFGTAIQHSTVMVLLMEIDPKHYRVLFREHCVTEFAHCATELTRDIQQAFPKPSALLFMADPDPDANRLLGRIRENLGPTVPMACSMAGNYQQNKERFVFTGHYTSDRAVAGLVIDAAVFDFKVRPLTTTLPAQSSEPLPASSAQTGQPAGVHLIFAGNAPATPQEETVWENRLQQLEDQIAQPVGGFFNRQPAAAKSSIDPPPQWITLRQR